ncbi:MAG: hypothetical protein ACJ74Z_11575 [Bryobacteraceae bacterium]
MPSINEKPLGAEIRLALTKSAGEATLIATALRNDPPPVYAMSLTLNVIWKVSVVAVEDIGKPLYVKV